MWELLEVVNASKAIPEYHLLVAPKVSLRNIHLEPKPRSLVWLFARSTMQTNLRLPSGMVLRRCSPANVVLVLDGYF